MTFARVLAEERTHRRMSQRALAAKVGVSESTLRAYECGRRDIPADVAANLVRVLDSPRLRAQRCYECQVNLMTPPWLDRVDLHPQTVRDKLAEELAEAVAALNQVSLINRRRREDLTAEDRRRLDTAIDELRDLFAALGAFFSILQTQYGYDHTTMAVGMYRKLVSRGYSSASLPSQALTTSRKEGVA